MVSLSLLVNYICVVCKPFGVNANGKLVRFVAVTKMLQTHKGVMNILKKYMWNLIGSSAQLNIINKRSRFGMNFPTKDTDILNLS